MSGYNRTDEDEVLYRILLLFLLFAAVFTGLIEVFELKEVVMLPCPLNQLTGWYCPGCGGTRAIRALAEGKILESICLHPLVICIAGFLIAFLGSHTLKHISKGKIKGLHYRSVYLIIAGIILVVNCLVKNYCLIKKGIDLLAP